MLIDRRTEVIVPSLLNLLTERKKMLIFQKGNNVKALLLFPLSTPICIIKIVSLFPLLIGPVGSGTPSFPRFPRRRGGTHKISLSTQRSFHWFAIPIQCVSVRFPQMLCMLLSYKPNDTPLTYHPWVALLLRKLHLCFLSSMVKNKRHRELRFWSPSVLPA